MMTPEALIADDVDSDLRRVCGALLKADKILICGHLRPDGDCLGSQLALSLILREKGKTARMFAQGPIPPQYHFLPHIEEVEEEFPGDWPFDLLVCVDCGELERSGAPETLRVPVVNIDHHLSNTRFGDFVYIEPAACAVGEQILKICRRLDAELTAAIATCLMLSIIADTGGFRYSGTTAESFETAAELARAGADASRIANEIYLSRPAQTVNIIGEVYHSIRYEFDGRLAWSEITRAIYDRNGGEEMEPEGLAGSLRGIRGVEIGCLLHETSEGWCRASIRSKGNFDVSEIAAKLGGGGHHNAAGCVVKEPYPQARETVINAIRDYFKKRGDGSGV